MNTPINLEVEAQDWPIAGRFVISRGARTTARVLTVRLERNGCCGSAECVPYARYGESVESVTGQISAMRENLASGLERRTLQQIMPAGAARNALDCALWDLEAKETENSVASLCGFQELEPLQTAFTISLGSPQDMAADCEKAADREVLKIKLGGDGDEARMRAIRQAAPNATLILDANEAWNRENCQRLMSVAGEIDASVIEQPLPAGKDELLDAMDRIVPVCADESLHTRKDLAELRRRYDCINIKLDKAGGLTEALALKQEAVALGFSVMVGCMVGTSLAMAPAAILAQGADFVDLDGPLLLAADREHPIRYDGSTMYPPDPALWG